MLSLKYKDIKNRLNFNRLEINKLFYKFYFINKINDKNLDIKLKKKLIFFYLLKLNSNFSKTKLQRRCLLTNRGRVSVRNFSISRIKLREMLKFHVLPGYKKAVW